MSISGQTSLNCSKQSKPALPQAYQDREACSYAGCAFFLVIAGAHHCAAKGETGQPTPALLPDVFNAELAWFLFLRALLKKRRAVCTCGLLGMRLCSCRAVRPHGY